VGESKKEKKREKSVPLDHIGSVVKGMKKEGKKGSGRTRAGGKTQDNVTKHEGSGSFVIVVREVEQPS